MVSGADKYAAWAAVVGKAEQGDVMEVIAIKLLVVLVQGFDFGAVVLDEPHGCGINGLFVHDVGAIRQAAHSGVDAGQFQQQGAGIGQVGLPAVVSACSGIERDMRGRIVLRQVGDGDAPAAYVLVFFYQYQIAVGNVDFVQRQQAVAGLIDGFAAAQCEQVSAQYGGEADVQALFGSGDLLFRQAAAGVAKLVEGSDVVESVHGVAGGSG